MTLDAVPLSPRIGTQISVDRTHLLDGTFAQQIRSLLSDRGVLLFRDVHLTDEEQITFAATLGDIEQKLYKVSFDEAHTEFARYTPGTLAWHIDRIDLDVPPLGQELVARALVHAHDLTRRYADRQRLSARPMPDERMHFRPELPGKGHQLRGFVRHLAVRRFDRVDGLQSVDEPLLVRGRSSYAA